MRRHDIRIMLTLYYLVRRSHSFSVKKGPIHTLLLCRHGDSIWNGGQPGTEEIFTGWTDIPLSQKGEYEAANAGKEVSNFAYNIDVCFTSMLHRAQQTADYILQSIKESGSAPDTIVDYRMNERHYGALQTLSKKDVEAGRYGHDARDVRAWRRSWHSVPPLLEDDDPRRVQELQQFSELCGGPENVPRGESLELVARNRVRPFLLDRLTPMLDAIAGEKGSGATGLVVAHANSLRALIGVICEVEQDESALHILESLRIQTGVPLVLKFRQVGESFEVSSMPEADECIVDYFDGPGMAQNAPSNLGHQRLPVWPLQQCTPTQETFETNHDVHVPSRSRN